MLVVGTIVWSYYGLFVCKKRQLLIFLSLIAIYLQFFWYMEKVEIPFFGHSNKIKMKIIHFFKKI